jgi:hypothetical protein
VVDNPDAGCYELLIVNMAGSEPLLHPTDCIPTLATANELKDAIKSFFSDNFASSITVTRTDYDDQGVETTDANLIDSIVYNIKLNK